MSRPSAAKQKGLQATRLPLHRRHVYQPDVSSGKDQSRRHPNACGVAV